MSLKKSYLEYLQDIRNSLLRIVILVVIIIILNITLSIHIYNFHGYEIPFLYPDPLNNIAIQVILTMKQNLLSDNITLIQVAPGQAFFAQIHMAGLLGIMFAAPLIIREFIVFIGPGLYKHEKATIKKIFMPAILLFSIGCAFSYFIVMPHMIAFLYQYGESIGVVTFFDISKFITFVMQFLIIFGFSYQLPLIMWAITIAEIVRPTFWRDNMRYVIIIIVVFGAVITPDGSGITMWFIAGPMILMYGIGFIIIQRKKIK